MDKTRLNKIQETAEAEVLDSWQDKRFNPLNERYLPANQQSAADEDWIDRRFASGPAEVSHPLKNEIVKFANSDPDAQKLLARAGVRDEADGSEFRTRTCLGEWAGTMQHDEANGRWIFTLQREDGERRIIFVGGGVDDRSAAIVEACDQLKEADETAHIRILGPDQYLLVNRIAARDPQEAITVGLAMLFGDETDNPELNPYEAITKAENQEPLEQLMWCVFTGSSPCDKISGEDLKQFEQFAVDFIGDRAWNLSLLRAALGDFRNRKINQNLIDRKMQQPAPEFDYDALDENEIEATMDSVTRTFAKAMRDRHR